MQLGALHCPEETDSLLVVEGMRQRHSEVEVDVAEVALKDSPAAEVLYLGVEVMHHTIVREVEGHEV